MRILALYDIHGNDDALEAVLADPRAADPDAVVVGGDAVPGPFAARRWPAWTRSRCPSTGPRQRRARGGRGGAPADPDDVAARHRRAHGGASSARRGRARSARSR